MTMPNSLPFRPWWWKPEYVGRHRGSYPYVDRRLALPYGLRAVKITPYIGLIPGDDRAIKTSVSMQFKGFGQEG